MYELYFGPGSVSTNKRLEIPRHWKLEKSEGDRIEPDEQGEALIKKTNQFQLDYFIKYFSKEIEKLMGMSQWLSGSMNTENQWKVQKKIVEVFLQSHGPCEGARLIFEKYKQENKTLTRTQFEKEMDEKMKHYTLPIN